MAFNVQKINPLDLQPRKAVGVKLPFSSPSVFTSTFTTKEAIKTNLINFFLTRKGERYLNPSFGSAIHNLIFELANEATKRQFNTIVRNELKIFFPRVIPTSIETDIIENEHKIQFALGYSIQQSNIEDEVVINFEV